MIAALGQDLRYAMRQLRKKPVGANTAIFSLVEGLARSPLPYFEPDRLVMVWENNPRFPRAWAALATYVPEPRAAKVDPMVALRYE